MKLTTLCFLIRQNEVLLAMKKRGFGVGNWNGVGGKVAEGESVRGAAVREAEEEITVKIAERDLEPKAILHFSFEDKPEWNQECRVFLAKRWQGQAQETDEMKPTWFPIKKLPFEKMWLDDPHWLPKVLQGTFVEAYFTFGEGGKTLKSSEVNER